MSNFFKGKNDVKKLDNYYIILTFSFYLGLFEDQ